MYNYFILKLECYNLLNLCLLILFILFISLGNLYLFDTSFIIIG